MTFADRLHTSGIGIVIKVCLLPHATKTKLKLFNPLHCLACTCGIITMIMTVNTTALLCTEKTCESRRCIG